MIFHRILHQGWFSLLAAAPLLAGCASGPSYPEQKWQGYPKYDVDPQVIYRIDDYRYLIMDNYPGCDYIRGYRTTLGVPRVFYRDDKLGIIKKLDTDVAYYRGKLIIDAPKGNTIAFPSAPIGTCTMGNRGCSDPGITYSTDAGRTWQWMPFMPGRSSAPDNTSRYKISVTDDAIFIDREGLINSAIRYPVGHGINYQSSVMPNGFSIEGPFPSYKGKTPSGMDKIVCDPSIKPRSVTYHKVTPTEYFELP